MKFSVAMCTYNGARFLREQLASIAAQDRPPDELVVCDDRSRDGTPEIVSEWARAVSFPVRLHVNESNLGSTKNFEQAIRLCGGELVALCDQDDVWRPEKLRRVEEAFRSSPEIGLVFTDAEVVDAELGPTGRRMWEIVGFDRARQERVRAGRALDVFLRKATVTGATMAFRAALGGRLLPIPAGLGVIHDGWIALVAAAVARVEFVEEPLVKYRKHSGQQIGATLDAGAPEGSRREGVREALRRQNPFAERAEIVEKLIERLRGSGGAPGARRDVLDELGARLTHLRSRAAMPEGRVARLPLILRELLTRRYGHYSNGPYSAVKDFLA